ncbi:MAG TPA: VOC family protein, partial [Thermomicrobiales bacterium]|nr:VOC family protein [Thermomicrobiales bacterium]
MDPLPLPRLHHIALTVTDLEASIAWCERVFGVACRLEARRPGVGKILADREMLLVFARRHHDANKGETFSETQTGLDHIGLWAPRRADLEAWRSRVDAQGVRRAPMANQPCMQSPIEDHLFGSML